VSDTDLTSPVMTSSSAGSVSVMKSGPDDSVACRQPPPVVFGDLLSSMHREVESTLRQFANSDTVTVAATSSSSTPLTSGTKLRDVCNAIIVHALRQSDGTQNETYTAVSEDQRPAGCGSLDALSRMSYSESRMIDSKSQSTDCSTPQTSSQLPLSQSELCVVECNNSQQSSRLSDLSTSTLSSSRPCVIDSLSRLTDLTKYSQQKQFDESNFHFIDTNSQQLESQLSEPVSRSTDCKPHVMDSSQCSQSRLSDSTSQITDLKNEQSELEETGSEACLGESKSCLVDSHVEQISSDVSVAVAGNSTTKTTTTSAGADGGSDDDGGVQKTSADVLSQDADDVDIDQPLCIDLNRDMSPDDDDAVVQQ